MEVVRKKNSLSTLPTCLCIKYYGYQGGGYGVWSLKDIGIKTRFGPYKGRIVNTHTCSFEQHKNRGFQWRVQTKERGIIILDGREERDTSWLRYINYAESKEDQNLVALQHHSEIYFVTCKAIPANTQLFVWYKDKKYENRGCRKEGTCIPTVLPRSIELSETGKQYMHLPIEPLHSSTCTTTTHMRKTLPLPSTSVKSTCTTTTHMRKTLPLPSTSVKSTSVQDTTISSSQLPVQGTSACLQKPSGLSLLKNVSSVVPNIMYTTTGHQTTVLQFPITNFSTYSSMQNTTVSSSLLPTTGASACLLKPSGQSLLKNLPSVIPNIMYTTTAYQTTVAQFPITNFSADSSMQNTAVSSSVLPTTGMSFGNRITEAQNMHFFTTKNSKQERCTQTDLSSLDSNSTSTNHLTPKKEIPSTKVEYITIKPPSLEERKNCLLALITPYKCHICHKRYARRDHLQEHEREHTGERPLQCKICKKAFKTKQSLLRHIIRFHIRERQNKSKTHQKACKHMQLRLRNLKPKGEK